MSEGRDPAAGEPLDPDRPPGAGALGAGPMAAGPPYRQGRLIAAVGVGGAVGTAARDGMAHLVPTAHDGWPTATLTVNLVGSFVLGLLLAVLARRGPDTGGRLVARLAVGTGFCGGLTTYSTLAVETDLLVRDGHAWVALGYGVGSAAAGLVAAAVGLAVGGRWGRA